MDFSNRILPFYMAYPQPCLMKEDSTVLRDLEYLQQMYPGQAKMLQKRIAVLHHQSGRNRRADF